MKRVDFDFLYELREKAKAGEGGMLFVLQFCMNIGLIASEYECPVCKTGMKLTARPQANDGFEWVCRTKKSPSHNIRRSVRSGSWFASSRLSICDILLMTECFVRERSQKDIMFELKLGGDTLCGWRSFFREACVSMFSNETDMIGGMNEIVEIGEIELRKRKDGKRKEVNSKWVLGGVQRGSNRCFLRLLDNRDKHSLLNIIKMSVLPGSTILSNCWGSYETLKDEDFQDLTVNYSLFFNKLETGERDDSIEETWIELKRSIKGRTVTDQFDSYVGECLWRRHHSVDEDLMATFLHGIRRVYPPKCKDPQHNQNPALTDKHRSNPSTGSELSSDLNDESGKILVKTEPFSAGDAQPQVCEEVEEDFKCFDEMPAIMFDCCSTPSSGCKLSGDSLNIESEEVVIKSEPLSPGVEVEASEGFKLSEDIFNIKSEEVVIESEPLSPGGVELEASKGLSRLNADEEETKMEFSNMTDDTKSGHADNSNICSMMDYQCEYCDFICITRPDLKRHLATSHSEHGKKSKCPHCAYTTVSKSHMKQHVNSVHLKLRPFKCSDCDRTFSAKSRLKYHSDSVHNKCKCFKCPHCDYTSYWRSHIKQHVNTVHLKLRPFLCSRCNYAFSHEKYLKRHIDSVHNNIRVF